MPVNNPDRAFFWDETNKSWRAAQSGEAGEYVWNNTTKSWEFGTIGAEYLYNHSTKAWDFGPGGQYVYNHSTKSWDKVTSPGYGGQYYWDTTTNSWVKNPGYDSAASSLFARMSSEPSATRKGHINTLISALKTAGIWTKLDVLYILAAHDAQAARLNWKADAYNLTAVNSPTFTTDRGYAGDGSTSYLDTGFNPTTASSPNFTQNSAHMAVWSRTDLANGAGASFDLGSGNSYIGRSSAASGRAVGRTNTSGAVTLAASGSYPKLSAWSRSAAGAWAAYAQGAAANNGTDASASISNASLRICSISAGVMGLNQIAAAAAGASLSSTEHAALYTALNTYLTAVGAA